MNRCHEICIPLNIVCDWVEPVLDQMNAKSWKDANKDASLK